MIFVSRETTEKLEKYSALIQKWSPHINLIAAADLVNLQDRHIADCMQLAEISTAQQDNWLDLGSGGGLPGLVISILRPDLQVTLVESDQRKATFLRTVVRETALSNVKILSDRIEQISPNNAANVSARALAALPQLMSYVARHIANSGTAWLMKGRNWQKEVDAARQDWLFDLRVHESKTDQAAAILEITGIRHV